MSLIFSPRFMAPLSSLLVSTTGTRMHLIGIAVHPAAWWTLDIHRPQTTRPAPSLCWMNLIPSSTVSFMRRRQAGRVRAMASGGRQNNVPAVAYSRPRGSARSSGTQASWLTATSPTLWTRSTAQPWGMMTYCCVINQFSWTVTPCHQTTIIVPCE